MISLGCVERIGMGRLAILALVVLAFGCVLGQDRDLEDHCSSFDNGLLPYCVNLDQPSSNPDCGSLFSFSSFLLFLIIT